MIQKSIVLLNSGKLVIQNDIRNELQSLQGFVCLPVSPHSQNQRPSLNAQHGVDVPPKNLNAPSPIDAAALAVPKRIGSLLAELGPRASSNESILKAVFGIAKEGSSRSSSSLARIPRPQRPVLHPPAGRQPRGARRRGPEQCSPGDAGGVCFIVWLDL